MSASTTLDAESPSDVTEDVAKTISYASGGRNQFERSLIIGIENMTGRPRLLRMGQGYRDDMRDGVHFWEAIRRRYSIGLDFPGAGLANMPRSGPLICVANHPFGILDGLIFGHILTETRQSDFRILANSVFLKAPEIERHVLPIDFGETRDALKTNLHTRKEALSYLQRGGCLGVFPGGAVATGRHFYSRPFDPRWGGFTAKLIQQSGAQVVPIFFEGANSRLFQVVSHLSDTLRLALLMSEFRRRVGKTLRVVIGAPLPAEVIAAYRGDGRALMAFLREHTYSLSPTPIRKAEIGKEWG